jgi:hypothetical protein
MIGVASVSRTIISWKRGRGAFLPGVASGYSRWKDCWPCLSQRFQPCRYSHPGIVWQGREMGRRSATSPVLRCNCRSTIHAPRLFDGKLSGPTRLALVVLRAATLCGSKHTSIAVQKNFRERERAAGCTFAHSQAISLNVSVLVQQQCRSKSLSSDNYLGRRFRCSRGRVGLSQCVGHTKRAIQGERRV